MSKTQKPTPEEASRALAKSYTSDKARETLINERAAAITSGKRFGRRRGIR